MKIKLKIQEYLDYIMIINQNVPHIDKKKVYMQHHARL
jgi:hypothetical protein